MYESSKLKERGAEISQLINLSWLSLFDLIMVIKGQVFQYSTALNCVRIIFNDH